MQDTFTMYEIGCHFVNKMTGFRTADNNSKEFATPLTKIRWTNVCVCPPYWKILLNTHALQRIPLPVFCVEKHSNASYVIHACVRSLARATHSSAIVDSCESVALCAFSLFLYIFSLNVQFFLRKKRRFGYKILVNGL